MPVSLAQLIANLVLATGMVAITTLVHFFGLILLTRVMGRAHRRLSRQQSIMRQAGMIVLVVFGIFALHTIQIWLYAALYEALGEFPTFEAALYFSTVTFSTVGYGDLTMSVDWRVLGAIEAANGLVLIAWSTAFLLTVTTRLKVLEHDWLEQDD